MPDLIVDGQPFEDSIAAADQAIAAMQPSFGAGISGEIVSGDPLSPFAHQSLTRLPAELLARGGMAATISRALGQTDELDPGENPIDVQPLPADKNISAEDANQRYGPIGPDGQRVKITDAPIPEGVAKFLGDAKASQIYQDGVVERFQNAHTWPVNFATGLAAFLADPLNLVTSFVPGVGEEAIAARLGGGLIARLGARALTGAAAGAVAQAPLSALRFGLGTEEASDFSLRDAFRDVFYSAAGNAAVGVGLKALGEVFRSPATSGASEGAARAETSARAAFEGVQNADAPTKDAAMRSGLAQMIDGRPVDVEPVFESKAGIGAPSDVAAAQATLNRDGFAPATTAEEFARAKDAIYGPETAKVPAEEPEPDLAAAEKALTPEDRAALGQDADLAQSDQAMQDANERAAMADEAGACLKGAA